MTELEQKIEGLLLYKNEPVSYTWLAKVLEVDKHHVENAIVNMQSQYSGRGFTLVSTGDSAAIMTSSLVTSVIASLSKNQEERELSKQALETLAIILYKQKITKSEIDYIRGVNSVFILRNLMIRGLIAKKPNLLDKRAPLYVATHDTLSFLGVENITSLPDFEKIQQRLVQLEDRFIEDQQQQEDKKILIVGDGENNKEL